VTKKEEAKARSRAAWRAWYRRHHTEAKKYYRERYAEKLKNETAAERELRLAQARKNQKAYAARKKKE
jgi:hypothetical protein